MSKINHAHKLKRYVYNNGTKVYFCTLPDCTFRISIGLALGKRTICWRCGKEFNMNTYSLSLAKPHCEECHVHKSDRKPGDRRTITGRRESDKPVAVVSAAIATEVVSSLKDRLAGIQYKPLEDDKEDDDL